jgi:hypothetical protein
VAITGQKHKLKNTLLRADSAGWQAHEHDGEEIIKMHVM